MTTPETDPTETAGDHAANAIHAAATWLQRTGAAAIAVAVVDVWPRASVGVWTPGAARVTRPSGVDDAAAELCEAAAPLVQQALERLPPAARELASDGVSRGARVQLLIAPAAASATLRLVSGDRAVELGTVELVPDGAPH